MTAWGRLRPLLHKKFLIPAAVAVLALAFFLPLRSEDPVPAEPPPLAVRVAIVGEQLRPAQLSVGGLVEPARRGVAAARVAARVLTVAVRPGESVTAGQVLLRLDDSEVRASTVAAQAQLVQAQEAHAAARRNMERMQRLLAEELVAAVQVEEAERLESQAVAAVTAARAQLTQARAVLDETLVRAPFAGTVTAVLVEEGDMAPPGHPLAVVEDRSRLQIVAPLGEAMAGPLAAGSRVDVVVPGGRVVSGSVTAILPGQPGQPGVRAEIEIEPFVGLEPGMTVTVRIPVEATDATASPTVPREALHRRGQLEGVYIVSSAAHPDAASASPPHTAVAGEPPSRAQTQPRAYLRWIVTEAHAVDGSVAPVLTGVAVGDTVVVGPETAELWNGRAVRIVGVQEGS